MKYIGRMHIFGGIFILIFYILLFVVSILIGNYLLGFIVTIGLVIGFIFIGYKMIDWYPKKINQLSLNKYNRLKELEKINLFDELYVDAYNDDAVEILKDIIDYNKISHVHNLDFDARYDKDYVMFTFIHKRHTVCFHIYKDKTIYFIDMPDKYKHLDIKDYEKEKKIEIDVDDYESLIDLFNEFIPYIKECIDNIDNFIETMHVLVINPKSLEEVLEYRDYHKESGIFINVLSIILGVILGILSYCCIQELPNMDENLFIKILLVICVLLLDGLFVYAISYSIYLIVWSKLLTTDINNQIVTVISAKPDKVKLLVERVRYRHRVTKFCKGIKLYFNNKKLKLIFPHYFDLPSLKQKNEIINEFFNSSVELKYYSRSKVIVSGAEKYRRIIKQKINKK